MFFCREDWLNCQGFGVVHFWKRRYRAQSANKAALRKCSCRFRTVTRLLRDGPGCQREALFSLSDCEILQVGLRQTDEERLDQSNANAYFGADR
ncbi:unnamed protein product [Oikopleura dioica]|uniref:Uncharacterized protein n=1 Tax=Oikopleura dioica TaxID=34765 RepID=E4XDY8_OIKDI|nr:unnamed protein product [Oikopleura dioica]